MLLVGEKTIGDRATIAKADKIEVLRQILSEQNDYELAYDDAREIGNALIEFYRILAEDLCDD